MGEESSQVGSIVPGGPTRRAGFSHAVARLAEPGLSVIPYQNMKNPARRAGPPGEGAMRWLV